MIVKQNFFSEKNWYHASIKGFDSNFEVPMKQLSPCIK